MGLLDRYLLGLTMRPLLISLAVVMAALLLERLLRLFALLTRHSGSLGDVLLMAANLVPHYLGLALPAALFISIYLVVARLSEDNELDALQGCGRSLRRLAWPFLLLGVGIALFSALLYGYAQPYARYAYRALMHEVTQAVWNARVTPGTFIDAGDGFTVFADAVDASGRRLSGVFIHQQRPDGETVTTAERGELILIDGGSRLAVRLQDAVQVRRTADGQVATLHLHGASVARSFPRDVPPFRPRGGDEREMTAHELWDAGEPHELAELHARLVRSLSVPLLPLLALPAGRVAKRSGRGWGIAGAAVVLGLYHHILQTGESLAGLGRTTPLLGLWGPFFVFALLCLSLFLTLGAGPRGPLRLARGRP